MKKNTSTSGDPLAVLGVSIETKQKTEPKPKKLKSESKCDVSATKYVLSAFLSLPSVQQYISCELLYREIRNYIQSLF